MGNSTTSTGLTPCKLPPLILEQLGSPTVEVLHALSHLPPFHVAVRQSLGPQEGQHTCGVAPVVLPGERPSSYHQGLDTPIKVGMGALGVGVG